MSTGTFTLWPLLSLLFSLIPIGAGIFVVFIFWKQGKERNVYLKQISEELRRR